MTNLVNTQMIQNVLLIWLDPNIDQNSSDDCRNTVGQFRRIANTINIFTDRDKCIDFLTDNCDKKAVMIISGVLCRNIVPLIYDIDQVDTIFIFCKTKARHEQWAKEWSKIKGIYTEVPLICQSLKQVMYQKEQSTISISFITTSDVLNKKLDQLDCSFMYTKIIKEILLTIKFEQKHIKKFIDYCRVQFAKNENTLINIKELETTYHNKTPIWWYTYEYLLYSTLNRALRSTEIDIIINMGFFLSDLHRHIEQVHSEQFGRHRTDTTFTVYRGQGISREAFEQMTKTKGGLMSFNNFLSTSTDRDISYTFAESSQNNPELIGILFVMTIDPSKSTTPFACISGLSCFQDEDEVLFSMHTVFRIRNIKSMDQNLRLFQVDLRLTDDDDQDLRLLTDRMREETFPHEEGWYRLGLVLLQLGQSNKAQQVYQVLLAQGTTEKEKGPIYHQLGCASANQGKYEEAIQFYEKSLAVKQQSLPPNHPDLASSYNNIGLVYQSMGEYSKALLSHEKALAIEQQSLPPNHPGLASSYNNIGNVYNRMGENSKALSSHEKSLAIKQQSLPPNHPDLASSYNNIGGVYDNMGEYSKALSSYEKALAIQQQSLPPGHPDLASSYNNIGNVYDSMGEYSKALSSHEKALAIQQQSLPPNHPDLAACYNNIGAVYQGIGEYSKALSSYEKSLVIQQQSLPPNHPDLVSTYNNIGTTYGNMGDYPKARTFYERAIDIVQRSLLSNHPHLEILRKNLETIKKKL